MNEAVVTITYDDGRANNFDIALPYHQKYNLPATFAIIARRAITPSYWKRHMQPWQIVRALDLGMEIASHGYYHSEKFTELGDDKLDYELVQSKETLSGFCKEYDVSAICIPFSASNQRVIKEAEKHYKIIRVHGKKLNDIYSEDKVVHSYGLKNDTAIEEVKLWVDEAIEQKKWLVLMLHGVVDQPKAEGKYDITDTMLDSILGYLKAKEDKIRCLSFSEVLKLRSNGVKANRYSPLELTAPGSYVLRETEGYMITYHKCMNPKAGKKLIISFGGLPSKKTKKGFGSNFILNHGYDHVFVAQAPGSQYQQLSLEDFYDVLNPFLDEKSVYTYGSSLGAYAAIYYGGIIDAKIIAAAPKNSAHPDYIKSKFKNIEFLHNELINQPISSKTPTLLYDPYREEEARYINEKVLQAYPDAVKVEMPFSGHTVLNTLKEAGLLKKVILSIVEEDKLFEIRLPEESSYIWQAEKGRFYFNQGNFEVAKIHLEKSISININKEAINSLLKVYQRTGEIDKGKEVLKRVQSVGFDIRSKVQGNLLKIFH